MKQVNVICGFILLGTISIYGNDSLTDQIQAMQKASPQERVQLMNQLKQQIATMNTEKRGALIQALQEQMGIKEQRQQNEVNSYHSMPQQYSGEQCYQQKMIRSQTDRALSNRPYKNMGH